MCGRYASFLPAEALARFFGTVNPPPNLEVTWNMAPTRDAPEARAGSVVSAIGRGQVTSPVARCSPDKKSSRSFGFRR
jgi:hypothetical protein